MDSPYSRELAVTFAALREASALAQSVVASLAKDLTSAVIEKSDFSPVTIADFAVQALLTSTIHHHFPADGLVGEESAAELRASEPLRAHVAALLDAVRESISAAGNGDSLCVVPEDVDRACDLIDMCGDGVPGRPGRVWVFDPIDGTKTFVRGEMYAVNVALLVDGKQVLGVVGCPRLDPDLALRTGAVLDDDHVDGSGRGSIVFAARGHGAFIRPLFGDEAENLASIRRLPSVDTSPPPSPQDPGSENTSSQARFVTCVGGTNSGLRDVHTSIAATLGAPFPGNNLLPWVVRWVCLALDIGNVTVWIYRRPERRGKVWDHAGAMLLFEEVGGKITDIHGKDIDLAAGRSLSANFGFVAAPGTWHSRVLDVTREEARRLMGDEFGAKI